MGVLSSPETSHLFGLEILLFHSLILKPSLIFTHPNPLNTGGLEGKINHRSLDWGESWLFSLFLRASSQTVCLKASRHFSSPSFIYLSIQETMNIWFHAERCARSQVNKIGRDLSPTVKIYSMSWGFQTPLIYIPLKLLSSSLSLSTLILIRNRLIKYIERILLAWCSRQNHILNYKMLL